MQHPSAEQGCKGSASLVAQWQVDACMETVPQQQISAIYRITKANTTFGLRYTYSYCDEEVSRTSKKGEEEKWWWSKQVNKTESWSASYCKSSQATSPNARTTGLISFPVPTTIHAEKTWSQEETCGGQVCICRRKATLFGPCIHAKQVENQPGSLCLLLLTRPSRQELEVQK